MAVIGIITCEILELEFACLLREDATIGRITVLADSHSQRLIELLEASPFGELQCLPHIHAYRPEPGETVDVLIRVLPLGLHRNQPVLRRALRHAAHELAPHAAALLLGYGLCGNALDEAHTLLDIDVPLVQPIDQDHPVDDCVALCLGGRDSYYAEQRANPGTFFLTPGWSHHWRRMLDAQSRELAQTGIKRLLAGYERGLLVLSPAQTDAEMLRCGREFCRATGLRLEVRQGSMEPLTAAWASAKALAISRSTGNGERATR